MTLVTHEKKRSIHSYLFEKFITLQSTKKNFSTIENTARFVKQAGLETSKPYSMDKVKLTSDIKEEMIEDIKVFTLNDHQCSKQKVILYIHGGAWVNSR
jgi:acetyl esterase/lipase